MTMQQRKLTTLLAILVLILSGLTVYFASQDIPNVEEESNTAPVVQNDSSKDSGSDADTGSQTSSDSTQDETEEIDTFAPQAVALTVWPDAKSFDLAGKSFDATILEEDEAATFEKGQEVNITTDSSTKFYKIVNQTPTAGDYFDLAKFKTLMEDWEGPDWRFTLKGETQKDGSILAEEIFYHIQ